MITYLGGLNKLDLLYKKLKQAQISSLVHLQKKSHPFYTDWFRK